jgi:hypothetical protein
LWFPGDVYCHIKKGFELCDYALVLRIPSHVLSTMIPERKEYPPLVAVPKQVLTNGQKFGPGMHRLSPKMVQEGFGMQLIHPHPRFPEEDKYKSIP